MAASSMAHPPEDGDVVQVSNGTQACSDVPQDDGIYACSTELQGDELSPVTVHAIDPSNARGFEPSNATGDWPYTTERVGDRIKRLDARAEFVRHDMIVEKRRVGRLIGLHGAALNALLASSQCEILVLDKEGPPPAVRPTSA